MFRLPKSATLNSNRVIGYRNHLISSKKRRVNSMAGEEIYELPKNLINQIDEV